MREQILIVALSAVFTLLTMVLGVVLGLLWKERHVPIIGFLWLFILSAFFREGITATILIGRASGLLIEDGLLLGVLGVVWFISQFFQSIPALMLGLYGLGIISARWITWLFKPKDEEIRDDTQL